MTTLRLHAFSLWSKWGFEDGDAVYYYCDRYDLDDALKKGSAKDALVLLVQRHLLPALPRPVKTYVISTIHNPIRVEESEGFTPPLDIANVYVDVTQEQVLQALAECPRKP